MPRTRTNALAVAASVLATAASAAAIPTAAHAGPALGGPTTIAGNPTPTPIPHPADPTSGPKDLVSAPPLKLDALVAELESRMAAGTTPPAGWAYTVIREGQVVAGNQYGDARRAGDGGQGVRRIPFTQNTRIEIMSATKPITAMAILRALDRAGVSVDAPVGPYLPGAWPKGKGFAWNSAFPVTFRHLLTHTSGILQAFKDPNISHSGWGNSYAGLAPIVAAGVTPDVDAGEQYKNANYALLRVMLPKLWALDDGPKTAVTEANHGLRFLDYVNTRILAPAGIAPTSCWDDNDATAARVYDKANLTQGGSIIEYADDTKNECGGHRGLHLSSYDLAKLTATLRDTTAILPADVKQEMFHGKLGWSMSSDTAGTDRAGLWWHGGDGFFGGNREVHTCVMNAPQRYQLAIVINSQTPTSTYQCTILKAAVNAAR